MNVVADPTDSRDRYMQGLEDRCDDLEGYVRTLREALDPLLLECSQLRNALLADESGDKLEELVVAAWRAIATTKEENDAAS